MAAISDPTMDLIRSLDDPQRFERVDRVAVFKPHVRDFPEMTLPNGTVIPARRVVVSEKDLEEIAANVNRAYQQDGSLVVLTVGHRKFGQVDETTQPAKVGYARGYRAEWVQRPGGRQLMLTHTEYVERSKLAEARKYPGRSPDYDPDTKTITGVALLMQDPALTLGTVSYAAGRLTYSMGATMNPTADGDSGEFGPDDMTQYAAFCEDMKKYAKAKAFMRKYAAEPGPTNVAMPDLGGGPPVEYQKLQSALVVAQIERQLDGLAHEGVQFDRRVELPKLVAMKEPERAAHFQYMKAHYAKLPIGGLIPVAQRAPAGSPGAAAADAPMSQAEFKLALQYQASQKVDWTQARAHVLGLRSK